MKTDAEPDEKKLLDQFHSAGMDPDGAFVALQEIRKMAGQNIIVALEGHKSEISSKIEALNTKIDMQNSQIETLGTRFDSEIRILGIKIDKIGFIKGMLWTLIGMLGTAFAAGLTLLYYFLSASLRN